MSSIQTSPIPWRLAKEGTVAVLDDGTLTLCTRRSTYLDKRGRKRDFLTFEDGRGWVPGTRILARKPHDRKDWIEKLIDRVGQIVVYK